MSSLAHIAKLAGVSTATVSRVLSQSPLVREETAEQVRAVIKQVGYVPPPPPRIRHKRRRRQRNGQNDAQPGLARCSIAIITLGQYYRDWLVVPPISTFVAAAMSAARDVEARVLLDEMVDPTRLCPLVEHGEIDGAILLVDSDLARTREGFDAMRMLADKLPVVWTMGGHLGPTPIDHVSPDNLGIGHVAAQYLIDQGCRNVAFVTDQPFWPFAQLRATAFVNTCLNAGIKVTSYLISDQPDTRWRYTGPIQMFSSFNQVALEMANQDDRPDGVFLPRDYEAARFYPDLQNVKLQPQCDIRVISCDNDTRQLSMIKPTPVTMDLNTNEIAKLALRCLRRRMRDREDPPVLIHVPPTLIQPSQTVQQSPEALSSP